MIPGTSGAFFRVRDILALFVQMGCELRTAEASIVDDDGSCWNARYLLNTETGAYTAILDLSNDKVSAREVAESERRLGVRIPLSG